MRRDEFPEGPFTWTQAKAHGITRSELTRALRGRQIRKVLTNVYVRADQPDTQELRVNAARLVLSPFMVVCDRTAAWLHGVDVFDYHDLDVHPPLEVYVRRGHPRTRRPQCAGGTRDLRPEDVCRLDGVAVTTPIRTAMDLGCKLSRRAGLAALDAFMRQHGITREQMQALIPRYFRRRGVVQLRELLSMTDPRAESPGESWTRLEIIDAGLPTPEPQYWVVVGGRPIYRLDLAYPHARVVAVEYDGREFHEGDAQEAADEERRAWLRRRGWTVIVLDKDSFSPEAVTEWIAELRAALRLTA